MLKNIEVNIIPGYESVMTETGQRSLW